MQQHSVVLVRGGRSQDCPGVKYHLVRGAFDLVSIAMCVVLGKMELIVGWAGWCWKSGFESIEVWDEEAEGGVSVDGMIWAFSGLVKMECTHCIGIVKIWDTDGDASWHLQRVGDDFRSRQ